MGRLVVFIGRSRDIVQVVQCSLGRAVSALAAQGVLVPEAGRPSLDGTALDDTAISHVGLLGPDRPETAWGELHDELTASDCDTALLLLPASVQPGDEASQDAEVAERLRGLSADVRVVTGVDDQLTMINDAYLGLVATWRTSARLPAIAGQLVGSGLYDHEHMLRAWYSDEKVTFAALPWTANVQADPISALLDAVGLPVDVAEVDTQRSTPPRLGPTGVEANRLLGAYLHAAIPGLCAADPDVVEASRLVLPRANRNGWSGVPFWGWPPSLAAATIDSFARSNQEFAREVWGTDWPITPPHHEYNGVDLLDLEPTVIEQVHRYLRSMTERLASGRGVSR